MVVPVGGGTTINDQRFKVDAAGGSGGSAPEVQRVQGVPAGTPADPIVIAGHPTADPVPVTNYWGNPLLTQQQGPIRLEESGGEQRKSVHVADIYFEAGKPVDWTFLSINNQAYQGFGERMPVYLIWRVVSGDPAGTANPELRVTFVTDLDYLLNMESSITLDLSPGPHGAKLPHPFGFPPGIHPLIQLRIVTSPTGLPLRNFQVRIATIAPWPHSTT